MRGVQLHRDGTGTYWSYDIDVPDEPEYDDNGDYDEDAYEDYVSSFWGNYNPLDHTNIVTFDASSPEAIDKFFDSIEK